MLVACVAHHDQYLHEESRRKGLTDIPLLETFWHFLPSALVELPAHMRHVLCAESGVEQLIEAASPWCSGLE